MKKYRVWIAYHKDYDQISVNYGGRMYLTKNLQCNIPLSSRFYKNKQPRMIMEGKISGHQLNINLDGSIIIG